MTQQHTHFCHKQAVTTVRTFHAAPERTDEYRIIQNVVQIHTISCFHIHTFQLPRMRCVAEPVTSRILQSAFSTEIFRKLTKTWWMKSCREVCRQIVVVIHIHPAVCGEYFLGLSLWIRFKGWWKQRWGVINPFLLMYEKKVRLGFIDLGQLAWKLSHGPTLSLNSRYGTQTVLLGGDFTAQPEDPAIKHEKSS